MPAQLRRPISLGFYGVGALAELAALKAAGFDTFHTYAQDPARLAALAAEARSWA